MKLRRGQLEDVRPIAVGGIAQLTLTKAPDGTHAVVRELHPRFLLNLKMQLRFNRGIRNRRLLTPHKHICGSISLGFRGLRPYEIIEYVPGKNLRELIHHKNECVKTNGLEILRKTADAIRYMHGQSLLHLDIKPENVLLNTETAAEEGLVVKLTDFDLSRRMGSAGGHGRLKAGTASHMAPEQLVRGAVGYGSDIFAFGVLAYYLLTGKMPFSGFSLKEVRKHQISRRFEVMEPRRLNPDLAPRLNWIVLRCLERNKNERFPNMAYLCQELDRV